MVTRLFLLAFIFLLAPVQAQEIDAPFDRLQGNAWALVLTGSEIDPLYIEQLALLKPAAAQIIKREIVTIHFEDRTLEQLPDLSVLPYQLPVLKENRDTNLLEETLMTDDDIFSVVLVGKEGITRYVWKTPVRPAALFAMMDNPVAMTEPKTEPKTKP